jgi:hypothetical protein
MLSETLVAKHIRKGGLSDLRSIQHGLVFIWVRGGFLSCRLKKKVEKCYFYLGVNRIP